MDAENDPARTPWKSETEKVCFVFDDELVFMGDGVSDRIKLDTALTEEDDNWKLVRDSVTVIFLMKDEKLVGIVYIGDERFDGAYIAPMPVEAEIAEEAVILIEPIIEELPVAEPTAEEFIEEKTDEQAQPEMFMELPVMEPVTEEIIEAEADQ